jgi:hypothetical protein
VGNPETLEYWDSSTCLLDPEKSTHGGASGPERQDWKQSNNEPTPWCIDHETLMVNSACQLFMEAEGWLARSRRLSINTSYAFFIPYEGYMTQPPQTPRLDHGDNIWCRVQIMEVLITQFPSSLLGPNILLRNLFSSTLNLCSFLSVKDQVSQLHNLQFCIF